MPGTLIFQQKHTRVELSLHPSNFLLEIPLASFCWALEL